MPVPVARVRPLLSVLHELIDTGLTPKVRLPRLDAARLADLEREADLKWSGGEELRAFGAAPGGFHRHRAGAGAARACAPSCAPTSSRAWPGCSSCASTTSAASSPTTWAWARPCRRSRTSLVEKEAGRLDRPALVVAPTSLIANWRREAARFAPDLRVLVLHGPERKRALRRDRRARRRAHHLSAAVARQARRCWRRSSTCVILDEAQVIKNAADAGRRRWCASSRRATACA